MHAVAMLRGDDRAHVRLRRRRSVGPTLIARAASTSEGSNRSAAAPTVIAVEPAMQRSPAQPNAAVESASTVFGTSASGITTM